ncbi:alpha-glucan family phosphorylase [Haloactinospora alba]|uniref:alpha-glucan family phosphorylase n=1 Tax=Haloactinospora alba TaxID=405555 RepID=UPI001152906F|nr:alpha-glucan family phosphorylase [Haloactinospora alba]
MKAIHRFTVRPDIPDELCELERLAGNLRWAWHTPARDVFELMDPRLWADVGHDPVRALAEVSGGRLAELRADTEFRERLREASADLEAYLTEPRWYQSLDTDTPEEAPPAAVAYFSAEYGITATLPQYSGGLGILAGDHLKSASDLGVPLIGVGLLYRCGYAAQSLSPEGWQQEEYPEIDPAVLPMTRLLDGDEPVRVRIGSPDGNTVTAGVWVLRVGRVPLLLLDTYAEENTPEAREVTDRLYGGDAEHRLRQELLLGVGGMRAVRAYCGITGHPEPDVFHMNEGHAGFLGVERIREYCESAGLTFDEAVEAARAGTVFTTHTPVAAGIDRFPRQLVERYFTAGTPAVRGLPAGQVLRLGAEDHAGGDPAVFNMALMGMRLAQRVNGVSRLHGEVSREMFQGLWPGFNVADVPITSVTNGVHARSWVAPEAQRLAQRTVPDPDEFTRTEGWRKVSSASDAELWEMRRELRSRLVAEARVRLAESQRHRGVGPTGGADPRNALDPDILTLGFARRVPSYKRLTLMLRDPQRLKAILTHPRYPVQLVIAGKAHPNDEDGKRLIQEIVRFADDPEVSHRIVFLPGYDMDLARSLVQGCDVWLNNPLRPLEACGTSGMKSALNGGLNLSVRDGWWEELFDGSNGWEIPTAEDAADPDQRDAREAEALYELVERQVAPLFYERDGDGLPRRWLAMVKNTLVSLGPRVLASRMVRDYVTRIYQGAAESSRCLAGSDGKGARELAAWKQRVRQAWPKVRIERVELLPESAGAGSDGGATVRATVDLGELTPREVALDVASAPGTGRADAASGPLGGVLNAVDGSASRARVHYTGVVPWPEAELASCTVRARPAHPLLSGPAEMGLETARVCG